MAKRARRLIETYPGPAAELLARLREQADLSITEMAAAVEMKRPRYHYYERAFKGEYLPLPLVVRVMGALMPRGVPADDILKLLPDVVRKVVREEMQGVHDQLLRLEELIRAMRGEGAHDAPAKPLLPGSPPKRTH